MIASACTPNSQLTVSLYGWLLQVRVVLDSCDELQSLQASVCSHLQTNMQASWTTPLVRVDGLALGSDSRFSMS